MSTPVREFVESGSVIVGGVFESIPPGKMNRIFSAAVKGAVLLVVPELGPRGVQNRFSGLRDFPLVAGLGNVRRHSVDLLGVENGVDPADRSGVLVGAGLGSGILGVLGLGLAFGGFELPELDLGTFLALADLPAICLRLAVGQPPGVLIAFSRANGHQVQGVAASVGSLRGRIERELERAGFPRGLPRGDALLQHFDDLIGDVLAKVAFRSDGCLCA